ncbi:MAG: MBL fold metallo-hydrolase [Mediterranea sp.]|jgi:glyoxylase-like metal-dependent hydrolase (beta-lactamase superfamily II)|nr:MBL fold metallo-hydrolase [Mediterranea sp.]
MKKSILLLLAVAPLAGSAQEAASTALPTHKVGKYEVVLLPENQGTGNASILVGATPEMVQQAIPEGSYPNAVNAFLVKSPQGNILFDTGFGRNLTQNLASAGVKPEEIGTLVITHMHGDHIGGMLREGRPAFPKATLILSPVEKQYWVDEQKNKGAVDALDAYIKYSNVVLQSPGQLDNLEKGDGIFYIAAYGHTPGHIACLLRSEGEQLLIWGDLAHAMAIQMPFPEVSVRYDSDPAEAARTRRHILEYVARHNIAVAGMHIASPGMGRIVAKDGGFRFEPFK